MVIISGEFRVNVALRGEAMEEMARMAQASQAEAGCIAYNFYADLQKQDTFFIYEAWATQDALEAHMETPHMAHLRTVLPRLLAEEIALTRYQAQAVP